MSEIQSRTTTAPSANDPILGEVVGRLVETYRPDRIYLIGSTARGEAGPDGDYDIMTVVRDVASGERRDCGLAYQTLRGLGIAKDILISTRTNFDKQLHLKATFPSTIVREGKLLHGT